MGFLCGSRRAKLGPKAGLFVVVASSLFFLSATPALAAGGISGTVTAATGGANLQNVDVFALDPSTGQTGQTCTAANGTYSIPLPAGSYTVQFDAASGSCGPPQNFATQFYNNKSSFATADPVLVASSPITGINASMAAGGTISGTVTAATGGANLQNVDVSAYDPSTGVSGQACTAANGTYSVVGLQTGSYRVQFNASSGFCAPPQNFVTQFYNNKSSFASADPVSVTAGSVTSPINASMATAGTISGTVTAASGGPLQNVGVVAFGSTGNSVGSACTASDGTYSMVGLGAGGYKIQFDAASSSCGPPQNYLTQFYNNKPSLAAADPVTVTAGATTPGVNASMQAGGQITGTVTDGSTGSALQGIGIALYDGGTRPTRLTCTAADGTYTFSGLTTGTYHVSFDEFGFLCGVGVGAGYQPQFYRDKSSLASADPVSVTAPQTTSGIDGTLAPSGTHLLSVTTAGSGSGSVSSSPGGISCAATCAHAFTSGTAVTLTAVPASGSTFSGWSGGGCSGTGTCPVTMSSDQAVTATFTATPPPATHTLTLSRAGSGSGTVVSSPAGISCGATCAQAFTSGTAVTLVAAPASGSAFSGWSGGGCSGTGTCTVTMSSDQAVTATFATVPPAPKCSLTPKSKKVLLKAKKGNAGSKSKVGRLYVKVTCDRNASLKLTGKVTEIVTKPKHDKKVFNLGAKHASATAGKTLVISVGLPGGALKALKHGAQESVQFVLQATNANGTSQTTAKISRLTGS